MLKRIFKRGVRNGGISQMNNFLMVFKQVTHQVALTEISGNIWNFPRQSTYRCCSSTNHSDAPPRSKQPWDQMRTYVPGATNDQCTSRHTYLTFVNKATGR